METFYFRLHPELHGFPNDGETIFRLEEVENEYRVFFKMNEDDEEEIYVAYTLQEIADSLIANHWIITG